MADRGNGTEHLSVRELLAKGELRAAALREADAAERDGYEVTAELLRLLVDALPKGTHDG